VRNWRVFANPVTYCKSTLKADKYENFKVKDFKESLWCLVPNGDDFILVGVIYRSPASSTDNDARMMDLITKATRNCKSHLLIMGVFNFPEIDWRNGHHLVVMLAATPFYLHYMIIFFFNMLILQLGTG